MRDLTASAPQLSYRSRGITPARGAPLPDPAALTLRYRTASHHPDRPIRHVSRSLPSTCTHQPRVHLPGAAYHDPLGLIGHVRGVINRATDAGPPKITSLPHANRSGSGSSLPPRALLPRRGPTRSPAGAPRPPSPPPARGLLPPARRERQAAASFGAASGSPPQPEIRLRKEGDKAGRPRIGSNCWVAAGGRSIPRRAGDSY